MVERVERSGGRHSAPSASCEYFPGEEEGVAPPSSSVAPFHDYYANNPISDNDSKGSGGHSNINQRGSIDGGRCRITSEDETFLAEALLEGSPPARRGADCVQTVSLEAETSFIVSSHVEPTIASDAAEAAAEVADSGLGSKNHDTILGSGVLTDEWTTKTARKRTAPDDSPQEARKKATRRPKNNEARVERNAREKDRSLAIAGNIREIGQLLKAGGVFCLRKNSKNEVLAEAVKYIRVLEDRVRTLDQERFKMMQMAQQVRLNHPAPQNVVAPEVVRKPSASNLQNKLVTRDGNWASSVYFGEAPPAELPGRTIDNHGAGCSVSSCGSDVTQDSTFNMLETSTLLNDVDYRTIFQTCPAGMAIASLGGKFVDCNQEFCQTTKCSKQEVCSTTLFHLIHKEDLQEAFDSLSKLVSSFESLLDPSNAIPCILRGRLIQGDQCLSIAVITGKDGRAHSFSVTIVAPPSNEKHEMEAATPLPSLTKSMPPIFPCLSVVSLVSEGSYVVA